ncbi:branched-chain amino acid ABC transporter permease [Amycolatopsis aidingensis]|uniref:branched-chain amino acid ABC transporter permease n=1 Tax=Amycolatopsis aidingensis TaxID=2842453 RepID=UPI001C0E2874|nr:branched-chain amino acid ABC transporter permease [Amycolatopsis aidingensis]
MTGTVRTWPRPLRWAMAVLGVAALAVLPMFPPPLLDTPGTSFSWVMAQVAMIALVGLGLNVVVGQAGLLDLGYVGFYAVGAYTVALLTSSESPWHAGGLFASGWAWLAALPLAAAITAVSGLLLGMPTLRLRGDYLAIVTLGFGEIVRLLAENLSEVTNGSRGLREIAYPNVGASAERPEGYFAAGNVIGPIDAGVAWFWLGLGLILLVLVLAGNLERSRVGRAWIAIREDEEAAEIMGVPTFRFKVWAFVVGAALGGLSGAIYAGQVQFVNPTNFNIINSMLFLCAVIIGGRGNKFGVIVGAFLIVYLPNRFMSVELGGQPLGDYKYLFFGIVLVALMVFRPQGVLPARRVRLCYRPADDSEPRR